MSIRALFLPQGAQHVSLRPKALRPRRRPSRHAGAALEYLEHAGNARMRTHARP